MVGQHCQSSLQQRKGHDITDAMTGETPLLFITFSPEMNNNIQLILDDSGGVEDTLTSNLLAVFSLSQSIGSRIYKLDALLQNIFTQFQPLSAKIQSGDYWAPDIIISSDKQTIPTHPVNTYINDISH